MTNPLSFREGSHIPNIKQHHTGARMKSCDHNIQVPGRVCIAWFHDVQRVMIRWEKKSNTKRQRAKNFLKLWGLLLMEEFPNNHLGWLKTLLTINNGIIIILGGAGFQISTVGGYFFAVARWPISGDFYGFLMPRVLSRKSNQRSDSFQDDVAIWWVSWWQVRGKMLTEPFVASF